MEKIQDKRDSLNAGKGTSQPGNTPAAEASDFAVPNSSFDAAMEHKAASAAVYRQYAPLDPAENEADRLSAGMRGSAPDEVRREMGQRLNADFSQVRFHSDHNSITRGAQLDARAWTSGKDVYFGRGGYDASVAAHELVHTVQQGAVKGIVSQHAPAGTIQRWPWSKEEEEPDPITPAEKADFLFRMEAGITAKKSAEKAEKSAVYARAFQRERRNHRNTKTSYRMAMNAMNNFAPSAQKVLLDNNAQQRFRDQIRSMSYDDYKEIMNRFENEAVEMADYREELGEPGNSGEFDLQAAGHKSGMNYKLYSSIIKNMRRMIPAGTLADWEEQRALEVNTSPERARKIQLAEEISQNANAPDKNAHLQTDEGASSLAETDRAAADYYKNVFKGKAGPKKKTRIDRLAEIYRTVNEQRDQRIAEESAANQSAGGLNLIGLNERDDAGSENDILNQSEQNNIIRTDSIAEGMQEKDLSKSERQAGIIDTNQNIDRNGNDLNESFNAKYEPDKANLFDDENSIIRNRGSVDEDLAAEFTPANAKVGDVKNWSTKFGFLKHLDMGGNYSAQLAMMDRHYQNSNTYSDIVGPAVGGVSDFLGFATGGLGVATGIHDIRKNAKNIKAGGRKLDVVQSFLDTATAGTAMVSGGMGLMQKMGNLPGIGDAMTAAGTAGGPHLIPGLNIATGAGTAISGGIQAWRGQRGVNKISKQINDLETENTNGLSKDQEKLREIFKHGKRAAELQRTSGALKTLSGGVTLGTGIAMLSGPLAPIVGAALGLASVGLGVSKFIYEKIKKRNLRRDVTAQEMNIDWKTEMARVRSMFPNEKLSDKEVRAIILKGHGFEGGTRTSAFKQINMKRAQQLIDTVQKGGPDAEKARAVISSLGVHRRHGRYTAGAVKLLAEKLGA